MLQTFEPNKIKYKLCNMLISISTLDKFLIIVSAATSFKDLTLRGGGRIGCELVKNQPDTGFLATHESLHLDHEVSAGH